MNSQYICAACRMRNATLMKPRALYQQRQWLSQSLSKAQDAVERATAPQSTRQSVGDKQKGSQVRAVGRYSRQPLGPRQILDELRNPSTSQTQEMHPRYRVRRPPSTFARDEHDGSAFVEAALKATDARPSGRPAGVSPRLWHEFAEFMRATTHSGEARAGNHATPFRHLQNIAKDHKGTSGLELLVASTSFSRRCFLWLKHRAAAWAQDIVAATAHNSAVGPLATLRVITACKLNNNQCYPLVLWTVSAATLEYIRERGHAPEAFDLVRELMRLWNLTMRVQSSPAIEPLAYECEDWSFLPDPATISDILQVQRRLGGVERSSFSQAMNAVVPQFILNDKRAEDLQRAQVELFDYPSAALVTLTLLRNAQTDSRYNELVQRCEPWMKLVERLYKSVGDDRIPHAITQKLKTSERPEPYSDVVRKFQLRSRNTNPTQTGMSSADSVPQSQDAAANPNAEAVGTVEDRVTAGASPPPSHEYVDPTYLFVGKCIKRLGRAVEQQDLNNARRIYQEVKKFQASQPDVRLPRELYESLLSSFLSLKHSEPIASIWADLLKAGHEPNCKTYTAMMRGCQNMRDSDAMESLWTRMRAAGIRPDAVAWATRVFGLLMSNRHIQAGMRALGEMGHEWIAAARELDGRKSDTSKNGKKKQSMEPTTSSKVADLLLKFEGDVNGVPRPSIEVMNSAISALAATDNTLIGKALSWGTSFGIEPNLRTYNVLINISMRRGRPAEAMKLVKTMHERGIQADSITWTVLLSAMFQGGMLDGLTSEEVGERVIAFVRGIEDSGGLDQKGYALILDRLLKVHNNQPAAQEMLQHMIAKGVKPTAEIYTIMMTHYLTQSPPDLASAEGLWARMRSENAGYGVVLDATFFDRMIELYTPHHEVVGWQTIIGFLDTAHVQGKRLSWRATEALARALNEAAEWERLGKLVEKARRERDGGEGETAAFGARSFWDYIASTPLAEKARVRSTTTKRVNGYAR